MFTTDFWQSGVVGRPVIISLDRQPGIVTREQNMVTARLSTDLSELEEGRMRGYSYPQRYFERVPYNRLRLFFDARAMRIVQRMETNAIELGSLVSVASGLIGKRGKEEIISSKKEGSKWKPGLISGAEVLPYVVDYQGHFLLWDMKKLKSGFKEAKYDEPKLLMRQTGDSLIVAYDGDGYLCLNNVHVINLRDDSYDYRYLLALLNSSAMNMYYHLISLEFGRVMAQTDIETIEKLPIPIIDFDDQAHIARHDKIVSLVEQMLALHKELQSADEVTRANLERQIAKTDAEIDALVYELYGLTEEEIAIVEGRR